MHNSTVYIEVHSSIFHHIRGKTPLVHIWCHHHDSRLQQKYNLKIITDINTNHTTRFTFQCDDRNKLATDLFFYPNCNLCNRQQRFDCEPKRYFRFWRSRPLLCMSRWNNPCFHCKVYCNRSSLKHFWWWQCLLHNELHQSLHNLKTEYIS